MLWLSTSSSSDIVQQVIPWTRYTYGDGIPFNYRSAVVSITQEDNAGIFRVYPARNFSQSNWGLELIHSVHIGYRTSSYTYLPRASYNGRSWDEIGTRETAYDGLFAPGQDTYNQSEYYSEAHTTYEGSYKANKGFWTLTMPPVTITQRQYLIRPYAVLLLSNEDSKVPTATPTNWELFVYNSREDTRTTYDTLVPRSEGDWEIKPSQIHTVYTGNIQSDTGQRSNARIIVVSSTVGSRTHALEMNFPTVDEISIPFIEFHDATAKDEVAILEYGCEYGAVTGRG